MKMNIGVVGLGKMGLLHTGILNSLPGVSITAITEKESFIANYIKSAFSNIKVYDDHEKMLRDEKLDLVYITTPISSHLPIALSCIENEINFFVEKPLTKDLDECRTLCNELKRHKIIHGVGYNRRFIDTFVKTKSLLESRIVGDIIEVKSSMYVSNIFSKSSGWRGKKNISGGGVLQDFGSHLIDLLLWYFGPIDIVSGQTKSVYSEVEDFAHMKLEFVNKIKAELDTSWSVKGYRLPEINIKITGTNGTLLVSEDFIKIELKQPIEGFENTETTIYKQSLNTGVLIDLGGPEYTREDIHMVDCVRQNKQTLVNAFEASKTQCVIQSMYDAADKGEVKQVRYLD
jgi:predicted dehydrogenase